MRTVSVALAIALASVTACEGTVIEAGSNLTGSGGARASKVASSTTGAPAATSSSSSGTGGNRADAGPDAEPDAADAGDDADSCHFDSGVSPWCPGNVPSCPTTMGAPYVQCTAQDPCKGTTDGGCPLACTPCCDITDHVSTYCMAPP